MKSMGAKIALWYAGAATISMLLLFWAGYVLLQNNLLHGLDLLNETEYQQISAQLGPEYTYLSAPYVEMRIRETTEYASTLFYIEIKKKNSEILFQSTNIFGRLGMFENTQKVFSIEQPDFGEIRGQHFEMGDLDVTVATPASAIKEMVNTYLKICFALLTGMIVISLTIGYIFSRVVLNPIRTIRDTANKISSNNLKDRIPVSRANDEISDLAKLLNEMFDRIENAFKQIQQFTGNASHELKTPLSIIRLHAEEILNDKALAENHKYSISEQLAELDRLTSIIEDLLFLSKADAKVTKLQFQLIDINEYFENFSQDAKILCSHHGKNLIIEHTGEACFQFDPKWIRQVLLNLLINAIHVSPENGIIKIISAVHESKWKLNVIDQGPGLNQDQRDIIFNRFIRLQGEKISDKGSGLGLSICKSIVELHFGTIQALSNGNGPGLNIQIEL